MLPERRKPPIQTLDDLFGIPVKPVANVPDGAAFVETVVSIPVSKIRDFTNHPYHVRNDNITQELVRDIQNTGHIETPAIVRPVEDGYCHYTTLCRDINNIKCYCYILFFILHL